MKNSNEDLPVHEELTNEINESLRSLKMKRNQINLDIENKLVQSYDFDSKPTNQQMVEPPRMSDKLISLTEIDNI